MKMLRLIIFVLIFSYVSAKIVKRYSLNVGDCRIPNTPRNGQVALSANQALRLHLNDVVPNFSFIQYTCNDHYYILGRNTNLCVNGEWTNPVPDCYPKCDMRSISSISHVTHCSSKTNDGNVIVPRCDAFDLVDPGTEVRIVCQRGYHSATAQDQITMCGADGSWSRPILPCSQICGEEGPEGTPYIVGGEVTNNTRVPWHVGIYKLRYDNVEPAYICGGTILSSKIVISAIHCFWDALNARISPVNEYKIGAGKFYSHFNDPREKNSFQVLNVAEIHYPPEYDHINSLYGSDIAVVVLEKHIEFKPYIAPVCIDYDLSYEERVIPDSTLGRVAGWGLEKAMGVQSDKLKMIELPVIERRKCRRQVSANFRSFLTGDKFCAGLKNQGVGLCEGDSGGGLVFPKDPDAVKPVFYLRGIVSIGPNLEGSCDSNEYTLFTNTAHFTELIRRHDYDHRPEYTNIVQARALEKTISTQIESTVQEECTVTQIPRGATLLNAAGEQLSVGQRTSGTVYIKSLQGSVLPITHSPQCVNGLWNPAIPNCFCPPINSSAMAVTCFFNRTSVSCSDSTLPGTSAAVKCPDVYRHSEMDLSCGSDCIWRWSSAPIECRHNCGLGSSGEQSKWDLYVSERKTATNKCFGALLNSVYIITHTDCLSAYNASDLNIYSPYVRPPRHSVQSLEIGEHVAYLKLKRPMRFAIEVNRTFVPVCVGKDHDASSIGDNDNIASISYRYSYGANCYNETLKGSFYGITGCLANNPKCVFSFGSTYNQAGVDRDDETLRKFINGIGIPPIRLSEDENKFFKCKLFNYDKFYYHYFIDQ